MQELNEPANWQPIVFPEGAMGQMAEALRSQPTSDYRDHVITQEVVKSLGPQRTVVDIGAGIGRFTVPLAETDCEVWAVEPSAVMRDQLAQTVGASRVASRIHTVPEIWPTAKVPRVEVALAALVIHFSSTPRAFIRAMEAVATRRCVVAMHVEPQLAELPHLWALFHPDRPALTPPVFRDFYALLGEEGIVADVRVLEEAPQSPVWRDPKKVLEGMATLLDLSTEAQRAQLATLLRERMVAPQDDAITPRHRVAVVSWAPHPG